MGEPPLTRLCIHTITTRPLALPEAIDAYRKVGASGITVWRDALATLGVTESARRLADLGLKVVSLCRGGFFPALSSTDRRKAIDENLRIIDEAAAIGAPLVVLVCGAVPKMPLDEGRRQIEEAIARIAPHAAERNIRLGIEPLHPMYAGDRSAVNTLAQANDMIERIGAENVGVTIDVYHLWWDDRLETEIARAGRAGSIFSFHVCDWRCPTRDLLNDRALMGQGSINIRQIRSWVESAGFNGMIEVEIFSNELWATNQQRFLEQIRQAYLEHA